MTKLDTYRVKAAVNRKSDGACILSTRTYYIHVDKGIKWITAMLKIYRCMIDIVCSDFNNVHPDDIGIVIYSVDKVTEEAHYYRGANID